MLLDLAKLQLDIIGARGELLLSVLGDGWLKRVAPPARGTTAVLTLPGLLASDKSLLRLNRFLQGLGYQAESWGLGRNLGPRGNSWESHLDALEKQLGERIQALADTSSAPVALIGQSLGGVYARDLAGRLEPYVDRVIMLGSPTFHPYRDDRHNRVIGRVGEWLSRRSAAELAGRKGLLHVDARQPALPFIAVHSPLDGIVDHRSCRIPDYIVTQATPPAVRENLQVLSTHIGMSVSPWVNLAIADRLAQPLSAWHSFDPGSYFPGPLSLLQPIVFPPAAVSRPPDRARLLESVERASRT
jgi:hypothetical protein